MAVFTYTPLGKESAQCEPVCESEGQQPSIYIDVMPGQVQGLALGDRIEIRIVGTVKSLRMEKPDNWSTGGSISLNMETSEIVDQKEKGFIDQMLDED